MIALYLTRRYAFHLRHWICRHKLRFSLNGSCFGLRLVLRRTHGLDVVPLATYGGFGHTLNRLFFPPWWGYFDTFRLISGASNGCSMTFRQLVTSTQLNEIHHHDSYYVLNFYPHSAYAAFDCHRLRRFHGEVAYILLWRPGVSRVL